MSNTVVPIAAALLAAAATTPPATAAEPDAPRKIALIVGIDDYGKSEGVPEAEQWRPLRGAVNDTRALRAELKRRGFEVTTLTNSRATRDGIVEAFERVLVQGVRPGHGDVALFHFSGHGQQVPDDDGDEADGYDEALVPYDNRGTKDFSRHLRDDAVRALLAKLRKRTDRIVVTFDSCHSGGATRAVNVRGAPPTHPPAAGASGERDAASGLVSAGEAAANGYVFVAAARANEWAAEHEDFDTGDSFGAFSFYLAQALRDASEDTTWREVVDRVSVHLATAQHEQHPQLEGAADRALFGGAWQAAPVYFRTQPPGADGRVRIEAGTLHGLAVGSELALFGPDARELKPDEALARVVVDKVGVAASLAKPKGKAKLPAKALANGGRAIEVFAAKTPDRPRVSLSKEAKRLAGALKRAPGIAVVRGDDADVRIAAGEAPGTLRLERPSGVVVPIPRGPLKPMDREVAADAPNLEALVLQALETMVKRRRLIALGNSDARTRLDVHLAIHRVETEAGVGTARVTRDLGAVARDGTATIQAMRDALQLRVENRSPRPVFVTVLGLNPDGSVDRLYPSQATRGDEALRPGGTLAVRPYRFSGPSGEVIFKVVATESPIDLRGLEHRVKTRDLGGLTPLQELLVGVMDGSRDPPRGYERSEMWGTDAARLRLKGL